MGLNFLPSRVKPGEAVTASAFNAILDELRRLGSMYAGNGLSLRSGASGVTMGVAFPDFGAIAKTTSAFGVRSGDTLADGTIQLQSINGDGDLTDLGEVPAFNNAKNADGGIADNTDVIALKVWGDQWVIIWVECPPA